MYLGCISDAYWRKRCTKGTIMVHNIPAVLFLVPLQAPGQRMSPQLHESDIGIHNSYKLSLNCPTWTSQADAEIRCARVMSRLYSDWTSTALLLYIVLRSPREHPTPIILLVLLASLHQALKTYHAVACPKSASKTAIDGWNIDSRAQAMGDVATPNLASDQSYSTFPTAGSHPACCFDYLHG
jgi:hypothetical protein